MEIKYLTLMSKTPQIADEENYGITEDEITMVESEAKKKFPKAYREFLFLGGKGANMIGDLNHWVSSYDGEEKYWLERQEIAKEQAEEDGIKIDRDYWVFADYGREQWHFFYLDEGDDPPVYFYCSYFDDDDGNEYPGIERINDSFSEYINEAIDDKKKHGY
jgi:SMI1 / KNR4 family (SUKH-1)